MSRPIPKTALFCVAVLGVCSGPAVADQVIADDLIVERSCIGDTCADGEVFSTYNDLKLKSANNRVVFEDSSISGGSYAANDWGFEFNSSNFLGGSYFALHDLTGGSYPLQVQAGAGTNALNIDPDGYVGLGVALPQRELHIHAGDSPAIRFDQSGGTYPNQNWDVMANEVRFAVIDVTAGTAPFAIAGGTPTDSLRVTALGKVGVGLSTPATALHVRRTSGDAAITVEETTGTTSPRTLLNLKNNGRPEIVMANTDTQGEWSLGAGTRFILKQGAVGSASSAKTKLFEIDDTGNATLAGSLTTGGPSCAGGCDAVFDPDYDLPSITDHAAQMYALGHLPNVGPTRPGAAMNVSDKLGRVLNEVEHAHIYIARLEQTVRGQQSEMAALKAEQRDRIAAQDRVIAAISARLATLEAGN